MKWQVNKGSSNGKSGYATLVDKTACQWNDQLTKAPAIGKVGMLQWLTKQRVSEMISWQRLQQLEKWVCCTGWQNSVLVKWPVNKGSSNRKSGYATLVDKTACWWNDQSIKAPAIGKVGMLHWSTKQSVSEMTSRQRLQQLEKWVCYTGRQNSVSVKLPVNKSYSNWKSGYATLVDKTVCRWNDQSIKAVAIGKVGMLHWSTKQRVSEMTSQ